MLSFLYPKTKKKEKTKKKNKASLETELDVIDPTFGNDRPLGIPW
jgi:hypothetical protein